MRFFELIKDIFTDSTPEEAYIERDESANAHQYILAARDYLEFMESVALEKIKDADVEIDTQGKELAYKEMLEFCRDCRRLPEGKLIWNPVDAAINVIAKNASCKCRIDSGTNVTIKNPWKVAAILAVSRAGEFTNQFTYTLYSVEDAESIYDECFAACKNPTENRDMFVLAEYFLSFDQASAMDWLDSNEEYALFPCVHPRKVENGLRINNLKAATAMRGNIMMNDYLDSMEVYIKDRHAIHELIDIMGPFINRVFAIQRDNPGLTKEKLDTLYKKAWVDEGFERREKAVIDEYMQNNKSEWRTR